MTKDRYILTVTLNPALDKTIKINHFKAGKEFREDSKILSAGGKGINVSRILKSLDVPTISTGFVGGAAGGVIKNELSREKIRYDFSLIRPETRTNLTISDSLNHQITRILEKGPEIKPGEWGKFQKKYCSLLKGVSTVVCSGSNAVGLPDKAYADLIREANKQKIKTILDTSGMPLVLGLRAKPFLVKPNLKEAEYVIKKKIDSFLKVKSAAHSFLKQGARMVIISLGSKGALASDGKETWLAVPPKFKWKTTVGCGDALLGGFLFSQYHQRSFKDSLHIAVAAGLANTQSLIPGSIDRQKLKDFVDKVRIKSF